MSDLLRKARENLQPQTVVELLRNELDFEVEGMPDFVNAMSEAVRQKSHILLVGETGVGKELTAKAIHRLKATTFGDRPYMARSMTEVDQNTGVSELFGHEKGAFTGADERHDGLFTQADGGILLLDEIGDIPPSFQTQLLRALQFGVITPMNGTEKEVNVQCIGATSDPGALSDALRNRFHATISIPPFRDRSIESKKAIALAVFNRVKDFFELGELIENCTVSPVVIDAICAAELRGNIRQLEALARDAYAKAEKEELEKSGDTLDSIFIEERHLNRNLLGVDLSHLPREEGVHSQDTTLEKVINDATDKLLEQIIFGHSTGAKPVSQVKLAELLGVSRGTVRTKLQDYARHKGLNLGGKPTADEIVAYIFHQQQKV